MFSWHFSTYSVLGADPRRPRRTTDGLPKCAPDRVRGRRRVTWARVHRVLRQHHRDDGRRQRDIPREFVQTMLNRTLFHAGEGNPASWGNCAWFAYTHEDEERRCISRRKAYRRCVPVRDCPELAWRHGRALCLEEGPEP